MGVPQAPDVFPTSKNDKREPTAKTEQYCSHWKKTMQETAGFLSFWLCAAP